MCRVAPRLSEAILLGSVVFIGGVLWAAAERSHSAEPNRAGDRTPQVAETTVVLTPATLEKWLADQEVVEIQFAGPRMEPGQLRDSLSDKGNSTDFRLSPGEGGGENRGFVRIHMKVTPDNVRRVLSLQKKLALRGYILDAETAIVWSFQGDAKIREAARQLLTDVVADLKRAVQKTWGDVEITRDFRPGKVFLGGFQYQRAGKNAGGGVFIRNLTSPTIGEAAAADQTLHLPRLGMIVTHIVPTGRDIQPAQRQALRQAFERAVAPLLKLEPTAAIQVE